MPFPAHLTAPTTLLDHYHRYGWLGVVKNPSGLNKWMVIGHFWTRHCRKINALEMWAGVKRWRWRQPFAVIGWQCGWYRRLHRSEIACRHPSWCRYWGRPTTMDFMVMVFLGTKITFDGLFYALRHSLIGLRGHDNYIFLLVSRIEDICWPRVNFRKSNPELRE